MFIVYVSDVDFEGFLQILTLIMCVACSSYNSTLMKEAGRGSIPACTSALSHGPLFMVDVLVLLI